MELPNFVSKMVNEVAQSEGFINYKIEQNSDSDHGFGLSGIILSIKLYGERLNRNNNNGTNEIDTLHLICKMAPPNKERREGFQSKVLFEREITLYTRVLPLFVKFQQEKGLTEAESFISYPKVYATLIDNENENYAFVMDDLREQNYAMWPRNVPITFDYAKLILQQLGRFHAVSFAVKDQRPLEFEEFKSLFDVLEAQVTRGNFGKLMTDTHQQVMDIISNVEHKKIMQRLTSNYLEIMTNLYARESVDPFGVVNHGDCWINNFLFRYGNKHAREIKDIAIVDWQISRYGSPAFDVLSFIFVSTTKSLRDQYYAEMINVYYAELSKTLKRLGSDPAKLFKFSDLQNELKRCGPFALIMGIVFRFLTMAQSIDLEDIDEYFKQLASGENVNITANVNDTDDTVRVKEINDFVSDVISYGFEH